MTLSELLVILSIIEVGIPINPNDSLCFEVGDNGRAYGCLQIHSAYVIDANRIGKTNYSHTDAFYNKKAFDMAKNYLTYYGKIAGVKDFQQLSENDISILARIHNGGPKGHTKSNTLKYWNKVKSILPK